jgi:hypothetical protein
VVVSLASFVGVIGVEECADDGDNLARRLAMALDNDAEKGRYIWRRSK